MYHVYISVSEYALHWFSRVLFIGTHREIMSSIDLNKVKHVVYKYIFPNMEKNEILMYICCENADIIFPVNYSILKWCNSFMQAYASMVTIQIVYCVYISLSKYALHWFFPMLFIATHGAIMYTINPTASQVHVLFCVFFQTVNVEII